MAKSRYTWEKRQKELKKKKKKEEKLKRKLANKTGEPEAPLSEDMTETQSE